MVGNPVPLPSSDPHRTPYQQGERESESDLAKDRRHVTKFGSSYSASKWGIIGLMKSSALELGERRITIIAVILGLIDRPRGAIRPGNSGKRQRANQ